MSLLPLQRGTPLHTAAHPRSSSLSILHRRAVFETAVVTTPVPQSHPLSYASTAQQHFADQRQPASAICICLPLCFSAHLWLARNPCFSSFARTPAHTDVRTLAKACCTLSGRMLALLASRRDANHPEKTQMAHVCCHAIRHHHRHNASLRSPHDRLAPLLQTIIHLFVLYCAACFNFVYEPDWVFRSFRSAGVFLCGCRVLLL
ncbi:hypothetical protein C8R45DRAFT_1220635 [Mycena sanguinolenta]|nr:hypothetical protein C8R45DRAFT_1220635 [Mycena sanguinolenta]